MNPQETLQQGLQHHRAGRLPQADAAYRQVLAAQPRQPDALHLLGVVSGQTGREELGKDLIRQAISIEPNRAEFYASFGNILVQQGKRQESLPMFSQATKLQPGSAEWHYRLGTVLMEMGRFDDALPFFDNAVMISPGSYVAQFAMGNIRRQLGDLNAAVAWYAHSLLLNPNFPDAHNNIGETLYQNGQTDLAITALKKALELRPDNPGTLNNLGNALRKAGRLNEAVEIYQKAIALRPEWPDTHNHLANTYLSMAEFDKAMVAYTHAAALRPADPSAHWNLSLIHLLRGQFERGWDLYEWRLKMPGLSLPQGIPGARWTGGDLAGKRILLYGEQGLGDCIQFIRFAPMVAQRGAKVVLACQPSLVRLLASAEGVSEIVSLDGPLPPVDFHCPLLSLPKIFATRLENIPAKNPYLSADPDLAQQWRSRIGEHVGKKIGLTWAGRPQDREDNRRSIELGMLGNLAHAAKGAKFFSLQLGDAALQAPFSPKEMDLIDLTKGIKDFADTAALIANLDLVITVDTAVAHLAGAMGKPVWLLLPFVPDWRWLLERSDSPWYPTMRLFRQQKFNDWSQPLENLASALREF